MSVEMRAQRRHRTVKAGRVVLTDWSTVDCLVRDMSATGARLRFETLVWLPETFGLLMTSQDLIYPAERRWRSGLDVGIRFTGDPQAVAPRRPDADA